MFSESEKAILTTAVQTYKVGKFSSAIDAIQLGQNPKMFLDEAREAEILLRKIKSQ